jgi:hypothetical protein
MASGTKQVRVQQGVIHSGNIALSAAVLRMTNKAMFFRLMKPDGRPDGKGISISKRMAAET